LCAKDIDFAFFICDFSITFETVQKVGHFFLYLFSF